MPRLYARLHYRHADQSEKQGRKDAAVSNLEVVSSVLQNLSPSVASFFKTFYDDDTLVEEIGAARTKADRISMPSRTVRERYGPKKMKEDEEIDLFAEDEDDEEYEKQLEERRTRRVLERSSHAWLPKPTVVVIGAGFAGLACAYELQKSGRVNVTVLEARERVGGRVWTVMQRDFEENISSSELNHETVERGAELVGLNHFAWIRYAHMFGLHLDYLEPKDSVALDAEDDPEGQALKVHLELITKQFDELANGLQLFDKDGAQESVPKPWEQDEKCEKLDGTSLEEYLENMKLEFKSMTTQDAQKKGLPKGHEFDYHVFESAVEATKCDFENNNGRLCNEQSLYFNLITIANGNRWLWRSSQKKYGRALPDPAEFNAGSSKSRRLSFWLDSESFRCREGNGALALKFKEEIEKGGGHVYLCKSVTRVTSNADGIQIYTRADNGNEVPLEGMFHHAVIAIPPSAWNKLLEPFGTPPSPQMGNLVKYLINVDHSVTEKFNQLQNAASGEWGMSWQVFAGGRHAELMQVPPSSTPVTGRTEGESEQARRQYVIKQLNAMSASRKALFDVKDIHDSVFMDYPKDPLVGCGYSCPAMGEVFRLGAQVHSPIKHTGGGNIYLCGEFACRYKWCGFMEGALISGAGVAKEILKSS